MTEYEIHPTIIIADLLLFGIILVLRADPISYWLALVLILMIFDLKLTLTFRDRKP